MEKILLRYYVFTALFAFFTGCSSKDTDSKLKQKKQIPAHEEILQNYYSEQNQGKWADLEENHSPIITISKTGRERKITVSALFSSRPEHYTELIILADYALTELDKKIFTKTENRQAKAVFTLPATSKGEYYILIKCNLHDTWYKKFVLP